MEKIKQSLESRTVDCSWCSSNEAIVASSSKMWLISITTIQNNPMKSWSMEKWLIHQLHISLSVNELEIKKCTGLQISADVLNAIVLLILKRLSTTGIHGSLAKCVVL